MPDAEQGAVRPARPAVPGVEPVHRSVREPVAAHGPGGATQEDAVPVGRVAEQDAVREVHLQLGAKPVASAGSAPDVVQDAVPAREPAGLDDAEESASEQVLHHPRASFPTGLRPD